MYEESTVEILRGFDKFHGMLFSFGAKLPKIVLKIRKTILKERDVNHLKNWSMLCGVKATAVN